MSGDVQPDLCVIGAGSGGLSVAAGAAQMGAEVVLIERGKMGGDCLNYGCVPSKALIAAAEAAHVAGNGANFGVNGVTPSVNFKAVNRHVKDVIATIAPHDSVERYEGLGVRVICAEGKFTGSRTVEADGAGIRARRFVIATGSSAFVPPIPGLRDSPYLTNETIFDLTEPPDHLIIIGGGPIGIELAQAHRRLGCRVSVFEALTILPNDDPDAVRVVRQQLLGEGIALYERTKVSRISGTVNQIRVYGENDQASFSAEGTHLLVSAGRRPNVDGLGLETAGIEATPKGIMVDARLRTTNSKVFAIGDVAGGYQFTHVAGYHAGIVIRNALFGLPAKADHSAVPWVTYTDPELAHVGLNEAMARKAGKAFETVTFEYRENDRAQAERATAGFCKALVGKRGRILGATIVGRNGGELILPWTLAINSHLKISDMASVIAPYPTLSEISKRAAGAYYTPKLFSDRTRRLVGLIQKTP